MDHTFPIDTSQQRREPDEPLKDESDMRVRRVLICVLLGGLTLAAFWPVVYCGFTNYDDPYYVTGNPNVMGGLTLEHIGWAFRAGYYANWHPLTWLSHMADVELFDGRAGGHHLTNLVFHTANTLLLFWVLSRMTGTLGRSGLVAALFAVHPLHVESVAWISERKDVLSTFFFMLTLLAYTKYVEEAEQSKVEDHGPQSTPHASRFTFHVSRFYLLSLLLFALGLMSKPMLVTLPFVLLLLDYWPLGRVPSGEWRVASGEAGLKTLDSRLKAVVAEKVPFLVLSLLCSIVTYFVQKQGGTMDLLEHIPLGSRLGNAVVSYVRYIGKMIWPSHLAVLYPHPLEWSIWQVALAVAVLLALTWVAVRLAGRHRYVPMGWLWYLGTLVPVIGLVQVGEQSIADRYTYIPMIGLFIVVAWGAWELAARWHVSAMRLGTAAVLVVVVLAVGTRRQLQYWQTGRALLEHSLATGGPSPVIHGNLGALLAEEGNLAEAERHFAEAVRLRPSYARARLGLVMALARQGRTDEAARAIRDMDPTWEAEARQQLGESLLERNKVNAAIEQYSAAARLNPTNAPIREKFGLLLAQAGKNAEASEQFAALVRLRPDAQAQYYLALSLVTIGKPDQAAEHYREALRLKPDWPEALNDLAWLLATSPRAELRNPAQAVQLAERACELTGRQQPQFLGTLDAAYASAGRFPEAITVAEEAQSGALATGNQAVADAAAARLELYRKGRPYQQPRP